MSIWGYTVIPRLSHPGRNPLKRILKVSNAGVEVGRMKREEKVSVICIEVVVQGKGGDKCTKRSGVHDKEQRTENRALRNAAGGGIL